MIDWNVYDIWNHYHWSTLLFVGIWAFQFSLALILVNKKKKENHDAL